MPRQIQVTALPSNKPPLSEKWNATFIGWQFAGGSQANSIVPYIYVSPWIEGETVLTEKSRCLWASTPQMIAYHDEEWGVPQHDDRMLFEFLILEGAQAGLSW